MLEVPPSEGGRGMIFNLIAFERCPLGQGGCLGP